MIFLNFEWETFMATAKTPAKRITPAKLSAKMAVSKKAASDGHGPIVPAN